MQVFLVATRNAHKLEEMRQVLGTRCRLESLAGYPAAPAVVEDAPTFEGNAMRKSVTLARWLSQNPDWKHPSGWVLADDSGLEVDALAGAPGVHSARFASLESGVPGNAPDEANNERLLRLLRAVPREQRRARFRCVLAATPVAPGPRGGAGDPWEASTLFFSGVCEGRIESAPRGAHGFGYDPLFVPEGFTESFAELGEPVKNRISHRAAALRRLAEHFGFSPGDAFSRSGEDAPAPRG